jgi:hypothetical protein
LALLATRKNFFLISRRLSLTVFLRLKNWGIKSTQILMSLFVKSVLRRVRGECRTFRFRSRLNLDLNPYFSKPMLGTRSKMMMPTPRFFSP